MIFFGIYFYKTLSQRQYLILSLAQWWQLDMQCIDAVIEVFAECSLLHHLRYVFVCCTNQTNIDWSLFSITHAGHSPILQYTQKFGLQVQWYVANLVEEQRTTIGLFELANLVGMSIGKSSFYMSKEFAFE